MATIEVSSGVTSSGLVLAATSSAGKVTSTTLNVRSGGTVVETTLNSGAIAHVYSGASGNTTIVNDGARFLVYSSGIADTVTAGAGAGVIVYGGGTMKSAQLNSAAQTHFVIDAATYVTGNYAGGAAFSIAGGTANGIYVGSGCSITAYSEGCSAVNITQADDGMLNFNVAGSASTYIQGTHQSGSFLLSNGTASGFLLNEDVVQNVSEGGVTIDTILYGDQYVSGGTAINTRLYGNQLVGDGGSVQNTHVCDSGRLIVVSGSASGITLDRGASLVLDGGTALGVDLASGGIIQIIMDDSSAVVSGSAAARTFSLVNNVANGFILYRGGSLDAVAGTVTNTIVSSGGMVTISGGTLLNTTINKGGSAVLSGGTANGNTVSSAGRLILTNAYAENNTIISSGVMAVSSGTVAKKTIAAGSQNVYTGGYASNTTLLSGGRLSCYVSALAENVTVSSAAKAFASGTLADLKILNGGSVYVSANGTVKDTTISGGALTLSSGANVSGSLQIFDGGTVLVNGNGAKIDFTVAEQEDPNVALINDLSRFSTGYTMDYTITVEPNQNYKTYLLAEGADDFASSVTVKTTVGATLGNLAVNQTRTFGSTDYTLTKEDGALSLTIESSAFPESAVSDYNHSGKSDMIQFVNGLVYVTFDTGGGYVQTPAINDITGWNVTEIRRDLTGDGFADIQITSDDKVKYTWVATLRNDYLENGCITLNYQFIGAYETKLWSYLGSADFNADGQSEILMIQTQEGADGIYRHVCGWVTDPESCLWVDNIWLGSITGEWDITGTADVTGDGADNVLLRRGDGMIGYWSKAGTNDITLLKESGDRVMITTGDFDGDGTDDFLWKTANGEFSTWTKINGTMSDNLIGSVGALGGNWTFAGVGDYDGDGRDDILWCDTENLSTAYGGADAENFTKLVVIV